MKRKIIALVSDLLIAALILGGIYGGNYVLPQKGVQARTLSGAAGFLQKSAAGPLQSSVGGYSQNSADGSSQNGINGSLQSSADGSSQRSPSGTSGTGTAAERAKKLQGLTDHNTGGLPATKVTLDAQDWKQKFADKFTGQVTATDVCIICSVVLLVVQILDWYNPFMDFMGHSVFVLYLLCAGAACLGICEVYFRKPERTVLKRRRGRKQWKK